jgi:hypothetical protein
MNEKEKKDFYVAMCKCCLLAQAMKTCPLCCFNIGLAEEVKTANLMTSVMPVRVPVFAMAE